MIEENFIAGENVLVVAPAGCGKTHLLAQSLRNLDGRQLVLTHTNAGVKELRTRFAKLSVSRRRYNLKTIDAFAYTYVAAYPKTAVFKGGIPAHSDWSVVKDAFLRMLEVPFVRQVIASSYSGVLVDEYQDCSVVQHKIIVELSKIIPVRIVGDPLQGIFNFGSEPSVDWGSVEEAFVPLGSLQIPYRWKEKNEKLGDWLQDARSRIERDENLKSSSAIGLHRGASRSDLLMFLHRLADENPHDTIAVIFPTQRPSCWKLAGQLRNRYQVLEDADCKDLLRVSAGIDRHIQTEDGGKLLECVVSALRNWTGKLPSAYASWGERTIAGETPRSRKAEWVEVLSAMSAVVAKPGYEQLRLLCERTFDLPGIVYKSRELCTTLKRALGTMDGGDGVSLHEKVKLLRQRERTLGRRPPMRCVSTTLLLKGLEFDHVVIPNYREYKDCPKHLYVALSRAVKSLNIFITAPVDTPANH
jgi:superfamily I DNA/RNA helicase